MGWLALGSLIVVGFWWVVITPVYAHHPFKHGDGLLEFQQQIKDVQRKLNSARLAGVPLEVLDGARAIYDAQLLWKHRVLTVCFWNGPEELKREVIDKSRVWANAANISFAFEAADRSLRVCEGPDSADIRIALDGTDLRNLWLANQDRHGDWSLIGRQAGFRPVSPVTMNLALIADMKRIGDIVNFNFHIRHEFGHALGLYHEHQRETCRDWFDYKQIAADVGWTEEQARANVDALPSSTLALLTSVGTYNRTSIMQYNFELDWYKQVAGQVNPCERDKDVEDLSPGDIAGIQAMYGPRLMASVEVMKPLMLTPVPSTPHLASAAPPLVSAQPQQGGGRAGSLSVDFIAGQRLKLATARASLEATADTIERVAKETIEASTLIAREMNVPFCAPSPLGGGCIQIRPETLAVARDQINLEASVRASQARQAAEALAALVESLNRLEAMTQPAH